MPAPGSQASAVLLTDVPFPLSTSDACSFNDRTRTPIRIREMMTAMRTCLCGPGGAALADLALAVVVLRGVKKRVKVRRVAITQRTVRILRILIGWVAAGAERRALQGVQGVRMPVLMLTLLTKEGQLPRG